MENIFEPQPFSKKIERNHADQNINTEKLGDFTIKTKNEKKNKYKWISEENLNGE